MLKMLTTLHLYILNLTTFSNIIGLLFKSFMFHAKNYREVEKANIVYLWKLLIIIIPPKTKLNSLAKHNWHLSKKALSKSHSQLEELFIWTPVTFNRFKKKIVSILYCCKILSVLFTTHEEIDQLCFQHFFPFSSSFWQIGVARFIQSQLFKFLID
jgi:hypothetical protein